MLKRFFTNEAYRKMGCPNLTHKIYFKKGGKKIWGVVALVDFYKKQGHVYLGLIPFTKLKNKEA